MLDIERPWTIELFLSSSFFSLHRQPMTRYRILAFPETRQQRTTKMTVSMAMTMIKTWD
jgi:hypothetical protein